jgi:hypothetical protein
MIRWHLKNDKIALVLFASGFIKPCIRFQLIILVELISLVKEESIYLYIRPCLEKLLSITLLNWDFIIDFIIDVLRVIEN